MSDDEKVNVVASVGSGDDEIVLNEITGVSRSEIPTAKKLVKKLWSKRFSKSRLKMIKFQITKRRIKGLKKTGEV